MTYLLFMLYTITIISFLVSTNTSVDFGILTRVVQLPSECQWDSKAQSCYNIIQSGKEFVQKIVLITTLLLTFVINGREFIFPFLNNKRWTTGDLQRALYEFDTLHPCPGMMDPALYCHRNIKNPLGTGMRSLKCKVVCNKDVKQCSNCRMDEVKLKYFKTTQSQTIASLTKRLKTNQRRVQRFIIYGKVKLVISMILFNIR